MIINHIHIATICVIINTFSQILDNLIESLNKQRKYTNNH